jgi:hypothetical protein
MRLSTTAPQHALRIPARPAMPPVLTLSTKAAERRLSNQRGAPPRPVEIFSKARSAREDAARPRRECGTPARSLNEAVAPPRASKLQCAPGEPVDHKPRLRHRPRASAKPRIPPLQFVSTASGAPVNLPDTRTDGVPSASASGARRSRRRILLQAGQRTQDMLENVVNLNVHLARTNNDLVQQIAAHVLARPAPALPSPRPDAAPSGPTLPPADTTTRPAAVAAAPPPPPSGGYPGPPPPYAHHGATPPPPPAGWPPPPYPWNFPPSMAPLPALTAPSAPCRHIHPSWDPRDHSQLPPSPAYLRDAGLLPVPSSRDQQGGAEAPPRRPPSLPRPGRGCPRSPRRATSPRPRLSRASPHRAPSRPERPARASPARGWRPTREQRDRSPVRRRDSPHRHDRSHARGRRSRSPPHRRSSSPRRARAKTPSASLQRARNVELGLRLLNRNSLLESFGQPFPPGLATPTLSQHSPASVPALPTILPSPAAASPCPAAAAGSPRPCSPEPPSPADAGAPPAGESSPAPSTAPRPAATSPSLNILGTNLDDDFLVERDPPARRGRGSPRRSNPDPHAPSRGASRSRLRGSLSLSGSRRQQPASPVTCPRGAPTALTVVRGQRIKAVARRRQHSWTSSPSPDRLRPAPPPTRASPSPARDRTLSPRGSTRPSSPLGSARPTPSPSSSWSDLNVEISRSPTPRPAGSAPVDAVAERHGLTPSPLKLPPGEANRAASQHPPARKPCILNWARPT